MNPVLSAAIGDGARVHVQLDRLRPHDLAPHEPDRVGAHRARRADRDDAAAFGGDAELLVERAAARQAGQHALDDPPADGHLELHAAEPPSSGVRGDQPGLGLLAHDDPRRRQHELDRRGAAADEPDGCRGHEQREPPPDRDELDPAPRVADRERHDRAGDRPPSRAGVTTPCTARAHPATTPPRRRARRRTARPMTTASSPSFLASSGIVVRVWVRVTRPAWSTAAASR